jgi:pilus assembly protein CpaB
MKSKTVILMVVAITCGLAASYLTSRVIAERGTQTEVEKVTVLVARKNISMGMLIKDPEKLFEEKQYTKGEEPKRALRNLDELKDRRLNKPLTAEQFVTADDLWDKDKDGISGTMQKGMRAVGITVNAQSSGGGFVLPHSHVDIVSVITNTNGETSAKIILQNILVLAVDQSANRPEDGKQAVVANTVTVQVTPDQAEHLALANKMGTINLILRSFGDDEKVATRGVTPKGVMQGSDDRSDDGGMDSGPSRTPSTSPKVPDVPSTNVTDVKSAEPSTPAKVHTLTIYNGQSVTKATFNLGDKDDDTNTRIEKSQPDADAPAKKPASPKP